MSRLVFAAVPSRSPSGMGLTNRGERQEVGEKRQETDCQGRWAMRIFFSVGEPSGDLHGSNLVRRLQELDPKVECVGYGGPKMEAAGCRIQFDLTRLAVMFLGGALRNLSRFLSLVRRAGRYFDTHPVDAVVLIDFSGFNWWIARAAKKRGIAVFYYGVPQMWAWAPWRIGRLKRWVDHVLCKLPFEVDWFQQRGVRATFIGHPYFDEIRRQTPDQAFIDRYRNEDGPDLVLLPGSRDLEVDKHLAMMLRAARRVQEALPQTRIHVAAYNRRHGEIARQAIDSIGLTAQCHVGRTPELMSLADACIACSGSVSLELMVYRRPTVVVYRIGALAMALQSVFLRCKHITLVNLMAETDINRPWPWQGVARAAQTPRRELPMPEYLTRKDCAAALAEHVIDWLTSPESRARKVAQLDRLATRFAQPGATNRAADYIFHQLHRRMAAPAVQASPNRAADDTVTPLQGAREETERGGVDSRAA